MDDAIVESEIEHAQLRVHQRRQTLAKRKYDLAVSRSATKRRRLAHLDAIAASMNTTRSSILESHPEARSTVPDELVDVAPAPPEPRWHGSLRANPPRLRLSLNDDYVGDGDRRRPRSLRAARAAVARRLAP